MSNLPGSNMTSRFAPIRLSPQPPALLDSMKMNSWLVGSLKLWNQFEISIRNNKIFVILFKYWKCIANKNFCLHWWLRIELIFENFIMNLKNRNIFDSDSLSLKCCLSISNNIIKQSSKIFPLTHTSKTHNKVHRHLQ